MRGEAAKRIGHLYPKARLPDGSEATVIARLWARTVASPNPASDGAHVPLANSFVLSSKKGREAIVVPVVENGGYRFTVSERKGWTQEALACNILATPWPQIQAKAAELAAGDPARAEMEV